MASWEQDLSEDEVNYLRDDINEANQWEEDEDYEQDDGDYYDEYYAHR